MKIQINDLIIETFEGARLQDALRSYSESEFISVINRDKQVVDGEGNPVELDGELSEGDSFYIKDT